jgi:CHASE3 domain sensor protein
MGDEDVPIHDYVDHVQRDLQREIDIRLSELKDAAARVAEDLKQRLGTMNEFRDAMGDITASKISRDTFESYVKTQESRIRNVEDRLALVETSEQVDARKLEEGRRDRESDQQDFQGKQALTQSRVLIIGIIIAVLTVVVDVLISLHVH